jgi:uncharacterized membrane protein YecN with MAPEG domain
VAAAIKQGASPRVNQPPYARNIEVCHDVRFPLLHRHLRRRAHGNFAEHTPLALLLIGLVEAFVYRSAVVIALGAVLLVARLLSAWGLNSTLKQSFGRQSGAALTVLVTAVSAALIIYAVIPH